MSTTIRVQKTTLNRLKEHGEFGDSWDMVINRVLDEIYCLKEDLEESENTAAMFYEERIGEQQSPTAEPK